MDPKMTDSRKRIQKWTQKWAAIVVSCSDLCFLFRKRVCEGGCPGAYGPVNRWLFDSGRTPFLEAFVGTPFFTEISQFIRKLLPIWYQFWSLFGILLEEGEYAKIVLGLEREPFRASFRGSKDHKKTASLQTHILQPCFLRKESENLQKTTPTWLPKRKGILVLGALGRSWGTFGTTVSFLTPKMEPKCSQKDAKGTKNTPNGVPNWEKTVQHGPVF